jgi:hypothetical protein
MIEIATGKDISEIWIKLQEVMERTKRQTIQIHELQRKLKIEDKEPLKEVQGEGK